MLRARAAIRCLVVAIVSIAAVNTPSFPVGTVSDLARGKFLVASTELQDPNFKWTVVLLLDYDARGAVGLAINRPTETRIFDILPEIVVRAYTHGWKVKEVPFRYEPRIHGASNARVFAFGVAYLRTFRRLWSTRHDVDAADSALTESGDSPFLAREFDGRPATSNNAVTVVRSVLASPDAVAAVEEAQGIALTPDQDGLPSDAAQVAVAGGPRRRR